MPDKCRAWSASKLFDTLKVYLKDFLEQVDFEKNPQTTKKKAKLLACKELIESSYGVSLQS